MDIGIYTFVENTPDPATGRLLDPATTREHFDAGRSPRGHLMIGSPQEVVDKILRQHEVLGHSRYLMQMSVGTLPHARLMRSIELLGTKVAPTVRQALDKR